MKRLVICAAAVCALAVGSAAADTRVKVQRMVASVQPDWTGWNLDLSAGGLWPRVEILQGVAPPAPNNLGNFSEVKQTWDAGLRARLGYLIEPA